MMSELKQFEKDLEYFDICLSEKQMNQFVKYYELLVEWNSFMNLTSIVEFKDVLKKHFIDSLSIVNACQKIRSEALDIMDIGTGAGFPGIPLKIAFPQIRLTLLDSLQKRVKFLQEVASQLELDHIRFIHGRAEDYAKPNLDREKYDICVSRAVANLSTLSELCLPYVKKGGIFISYKSEKVVEESKEAAHAITLLGGKTKEKVEMYLPDSDIYRCLYIIEKEKVTPGKYPRKAGLPAKDPL